EYRGDGSQIRHESARAGLAGEAPNFVPLMRSWGGVTIAYRKRMVDSPAYRLNHEEVIKALEEGITFAENLNPVEAVPDERGAVEAVVFKREGRPSPSANGAGVVTMRARTILVAAGRTATRTCPAEPPTAVHR